MRLTSDLLRVSLRALPAPTLAATLLMGLALAGPARAESTAAPDPSICAPVQAQPSSLPDLQQLAESVCRAIWGNAEPTAFSERFRLRIGGWVDASYQDTDASGGNDSIALNHANLHLDARLDERWQLFFEGEYEHEPVLLAGTDEREWEVEQIYGEYRHSDSLRVRAGRFSTPFGYWTPAHWSIYVDTIQAPIYETNRIAPEQQNGLRVFGSVFAGRFLDMQSELEYSLYGGYADDGYSTNQSNGLSLGTDLRLRLADRYMLGASLYTQENGDEDDRRENALNVYGEAHLPFHLLVRSEYVRQQRDGSTRSVFVRNADMVYAKLRWDFRNDAYLNYRFDFGEDDRQGATNELTIHRVTLGYWPIARIRLKAEYARNIYHGGGIDDYDFWGVSAGLFF